MGSEDTEIAQLLNGSVPQRAGDRLDRAARPSRSQVVVEDTSCEASTVIVLRREGYSCCSPGSSSTTPSGSSSYSILLVRPRYVRSRDRGRGHVLDPRAGERVVIPAPSERTSSRTARVLRNTCSGNAFPSRLP